MKRQLKNIFTFIFCVVILNGCGAKRLTYEPVDHPTVLDAMQTVRKKILDQPDWRAIFATYHLGTSMSKDSFHSGDLIECHDSSCFNFAQKPLR
ncbi:MAG: hypothetical protein KAH20_11665, partial [Methylococcales bacterium]|nr:hypothetical protein [Methylococcales bacterium]